jgi:hypothetical protein
VANDLEEENIPLQDLGRAKEQEEENIPLQDLGGATGQDDGDDTLTPLIHPAPEEQAAEAKAVEETGKNVPLKKRKSPPK